MLKGQYDVSLKKSTIKFGPFFTACADGDHNILCCNSFKPE